MRDTDAFKAWLGNSKAVELVSGSSSRDAVYAPQRMYHTTKGDFDAFEVGRKTVNSGTFGSWESERAAIFVTADVQASQAYGKFDGGYAPGANVMPVYVRSENPLDLASGLSCEVEQRFEAAGFNTRWLHRFDWSKFDDEDGKHFVETAKSLGYDAVIFNDENPDTGESFEAWALFDSSQLKSAIGNSGLFDVANPDVTDRRVMAAQAALDFLVSMPTKKASPNG